MVGRIIGIVALCLSLIYVVLQIWLVRGELADWRPDYAQALALCIGTILYAFSSTALAGAWKTILVTLEGRIHRPDRRVVTFARSQLGKYLPGNVAHIAGRHYVASSDGYGHRSLVLSTLYEMLGLLSAAGLVAMLATMFSQEPLYEQFPQLMAIPLVAVALPVLYVLHNIYPRYLAIFHIDMPAVAGARTGLLVYPYLSYLLFFLLAGTALVSLVASMHGRLGLDSYMLVWLAFAVSWLLGFLAPGVPSGIGVREAVLVYMLSPLVGGSNAVIVSFLFRLVTVGGDVLYWLFVEIIFRARQRM